MSVWEKIILTVIYLLAIPVLIFIMDLTNKNLKQGLMKVNPDLIKRADWFFSNDKRMFVRVLIIVGSVGFIVLIWADLIPLL